MAAKPEVMMEDMWTVCGEVQTLHKLSDTELPSVGALSATTHRTCIEIGARTKGAYGSQVRGDTGTGSAQYRARLVPGTSMEGGRRGAHGYQYASCLGPVLCSPASSTTNTGLQPCSCPGHSPRPRETITSSPVFSAVSSAAASLSQHKPGSVS